MLKTIPGLARELSVSDATVRRYITNFSQFFESQKVNGWDHYDVDRSLKILRRINEVSAAGRRRGEVLKKLLAEFEVIVNQEDTIPIRGEVEVIELGPRSLTVLGSIAEALSNLADKLGPADQRHCDPNVSDS